MMDHVQMIVNSILHIFIALCVCLCMHMRMLFTWACTPDLFHRHLLVCFLSVDLDSHIFGGCGILYFILPACLFPAFGHGVATC